MEKQRALILLFIILTGLSLACTISARATPEKQSSIGTSIATLNNLQAGIPPKPTRSDSLFLRPDALTAFASYRLRISWTWTPREYASLDPPTQKAVWLLEITRFPEAARIRYTAGGLAPDQSSLVEWAYIEGRTWQCSGAARQCMVSGLPTPSPMITATTTPSSTEIAPLLIMTNTIVTPMPFPITPTITLPAPAPMDISSGIAYIGQPLLRGAESVISLLAAEELTFLGREWLYSLPSRHYLTNSPSLADAVTSNLVGTVEHSTTELWVVEDPGYPAFIIFMLIHWEGEINGIPGSGILIYQVFDINASFAVQPPPNE